MNIVMALLALGFLIFIHELGHFWAARATGVRVEEFAVGFGPAIVKHKRNGILYRLNWVPLGGYVRMLGEDNPESANAPDNFNNRPIWARILVISAGVIMNMLGAFLILALLFNIYGSPVVKVVAGQNIPADMPAAQAGILPGDELIAINNKVIQNDMNVFLDEVKANKDRAVPLDVVRNGQKVQLTVTPIEKEGRVQVGLPVGQMRVFVKEGNFGDNLAKAFTETGNLTTVIVDGFQKLVTGGISLNDIGGPVQIIQVAGQAQESGTPYFLYLMALLSVNLAVFNILPFPALDGGRLVFLLIELLRRGKRISVEREASINFVGILFLLTLMVLVTFKDVFMIFSE